MRKKKKINDRKKKNAVVVWKLERWKETADSEVWTASKAQPDTVDI